MKIRSYFQTVTLMMLLPLLVGCTTPANNVSSKPIQPEYCLGAVGIKCDWVIGGKGIVTVGSILHDNCCLVNYPNGYMCHNGGSQKVCKSEWDKAINDSLKGRTWNAPFLGDQDDIEKIPARSSDLTTTWETAATLKLAAPDGTRLDRSDANFCASKSFQESPEQLKKQAFGTCGRSDSGR
jgi:hypothetical protein